MNQSDELQQQIDQMQEHISALGLSVHDSRLLNRNSVPRALLINSKEWREKLAWAREAGAKAIYLDIDRYFGYNQEAVTKLLAVSEEDERSEFEEALEDLEGREGQIAAFSLYWMIGGILHELAFESSWLDPYLAYRELSDTLMKRYRRREQQRRRQEFEERRRQRCQSEIDKLARKLLEHPKFETCQNRNDRRYLAEQMFGAQADTNTIVMRAETLERMEEA